MGTNDESGNERDVLRAAVRTARSIEDLIKVLDISPCSPEAYYTEIVWESLSPHYRQILACADATEVED